MADTRSDIEARSGIHKRLREGIATCRQVRKDILATWQDNVAYRKGKPFRHIPDSDTVNVPADWSRTKNKVSQLFFQVPAVTLKARRPEFQQTSSLASAALNFQLQHEIRVHAAIDECLGDVINASGIAFGMVSYCATFEDVEVPTIDTSMLPPEVLQFATENKLIPTSKVPKEVDGWYEVDRISPSRALWPVEFKGSDWAKAPWIGHEGYLPLAEAVRREWVDEAYEGDEIKIDELLDDEDETTNRSIQPGRYVKYVEIFYRALNFDPKEKRRDAIRRVVILEGKELGENGNDNDVVVDEPLKWQKWVETQTIPGKPQPDAPPGTPPPPPTVIRGHFIGLKSLPIKVLTLTSVSDCAIPPSDSEMGRPQVKEMIRSRSQMIQQREHSLPIRWFDVNMVDEDIAQLLRNGQMQDMIPMNGPGDRAIGEVARASYPRETFEFMRVFNSDLDETWSMGPNQQGMEQPGETSATEARNIQGWTNVRLSYERSRVLRFFTDIAEGVFGLMQLFSDHDDYVEVWGEDFTKRLETWNKDLIAGDYLFEVKPDSAVQVDVGQKRSEILNIYKLIRRDPLINPQAVIMELLELNNFDPARWIAQPKPPVPKPPNVRYTFKGEDLMTPIAVALIQKSDSPLTPQDIADAKSLITDAASLNPQLGAAIPALQNGGKGPEPQPDMGHPGPAEVVQPLNRRYEKAETGVEGSE